MYRSQKWIYVSISEIELCIYLSIVTVLSKYDYLGKLYFHQSVQVVLFYLVEFSPFLFPFPPPPLLITKRKEERLHRNWKLVDQDFTSFPIPIIITPSPTLIHIPLFLMVYTFYTYYKLYHTFYYSPHQGCSIITNHLHSDWTRGTAQQLLSNQNVSSDQ